MTEMRAVTDASAVDPGTKSLAATRAAISDFVTVTSLMTAYARRFASADASVATGLSERGGSGET